MTQINRPDMPKDPAAAVRALRTCRNEMLVIVTQVRIGGKIYEKAQRIIAAIDAMTGELTGDPEYFWGPGTGATEDQRAEAELKAARERGDRPWKR